MPPEGASSFVSGVLPTGHQLRAALRAGRLIDDRGTRVSDARASYRLVPYGGIYRSEDLAVGEDVLLAAGLLRKRDATLFPQGGLREIAAVSDADGCEALLALLLREHPPLWLGAATAGGALVDELIPDAADRLLSEMMSSEMREALLLRLARRFSEAERLAAGALAEEFVSARCQDELRAAGASDLAAMVRRVSLVTDQLGYDVTAPRLDRSTRRLEVKGARGGASLIVLYLTRNEAKRGLVDRDWSLVACHIAEDDSVELVGHLGGAQLQAYLPEDPGDETRWQSIRLELASSLFTPGLPSVATRG
jgi:hypothetical protein